MKERFSISRTKESELSELLEIQDEAGLSHWSLEGYRAEMRKEKSILLTATGDDNQKIGFIVMGLTDFGEGEIFNLGVRRLYRRNGVGEELLKAALKTAAEIHPLQSVWLEVRASNLTAIKFYRHNRFVVAGRRKKFYSNPVEDAVLMRLDVQCSGKSRLPVENSQNLIEPDEVE